MVKIIFDQAIDGHHLEYINHLFWAASKKRDAEYYFILNPKFKERKNILEWPNASNIKIGYFTDSELVNFKKNALSASFFLSRALQERVKEFNATHVFLVNIISFLPFIIFFINKNIKVSGIVYLIYLYRWKRANIFMRCQDVLKYIIFSRSEIFDRIFLLNDAISPFYLNRKFRTNVFKYLPDPVLNKRREISRDDVRKKLGINIGKKVFLHFGALNERKGTLEILKAINSDKIDNLDQYCFIFAGKVGDDIKKEFHDLLTDVSSSVIVFDEYCSYDFLAELCSICDYLLMPYKINEQSSGVLNYAALFKKPVIAINQGLIGKIVTKYKLGKLLPAPNDKEIIKFLNQKNLKVLSNNFDLYLNDNSVLKFQNAIL